MSRSGRVGRSAAVIAPPASARESRICARLWSKSVSPCGGGARSRWRRPGRVTRLLVRRRALVPGPAGQLGHCASGQRGGHHRRADLHGRRHGAHAHRRARHPGIPPARPGARRAACLGRVLDHRSSSPQAREDCIPPGPARVIRLANRPVLVCVWPAWVGPPAGGPGSTCRMAGVGQLAGGPAGPAAAGTTRQRAAQVLADRAEAAPVAAAGQLALHGPLAVAQLVQCRWVRVTARQRQASGGGICAG